MQKGSIVVFAVVERVMDGEAGRRREVRDGTEGEEGDGA